MKCLCEKIYLKFVFETKPYSNLITLTRQLELSDIPVPTSGSSKHIKKVVFPYVTDIDKVCYIKSKFVKSSIGILEQQLF